MKPRELSLRDLQALGVRADGVEFIALGRRLWERLGEVARRTGKTRREVIEAWVKELP